MATSRLPTHRAPFHPGVILEEEFRKPLGLTQYAFAALLGGSRERYAQIATGKRAVTANTALRIARVFGTEAEMWVAMQTDLELWNEMHSKEFAHIKKLKKVKLPSEAMASCGEHERLRH